MARRGENIHKRNDGRWEGRYQKGRDSKGHIIYGSVYGKTYREVKEKKASIIQNTGITEVVNKKDKYFRDICMLWLTSNRIKYKGSTEIRYQYILNKHIIPVLGEIRISEISAPMINNFLTYKLEKGRIDKTGGLSPAYVKSIMLIISSVLKFAVAEQFCFPLKTSIYKPTSCQTAPKILNIRQLTTLEKYLVNNLNPTNLGILITLYSGLRIGEICALSWEDVDLQESVFHIRHTIARVASADNCNSSKLIIDVPKTRTSIRDIPIVSSLLPILKEYKNKATSYFVISEVSTFVSPRTYEYRYHRALDKGGIEKINYHALRHTFATKCIEAGMDVKTLSEILGHSNVSITLNAYVHSSMEMKRTELEKVTVLVSNHIEINGQ